MQRKMKTAISYTIITIILTALALVILIPVVWIGICAFRPQTELMQYPPKFFAEQLTLQNFIDIAEKNQDMGLCEKLSALLPRLYDSGSIFELSCGLCVRKAGL